MQWGAEGFRGGDAKARPRPQRLLPLPAPSLPCSERGAGGGGAGCRDRPGHGGAFAPTRQCKAQFLFPVPDRARSGGTALKRHKRPATARLQRAARPPSASPGPAASPAPERGLGGGGGRGSLSPCLSFPISQRRGDPTLRLPSPAVDPLTPCLGRVVGTSLGAHVRGLGTAVT